MGVLSLLAVYLLGGLTFLPLLAIVLFLHAYLVFPVHKPSEYPQAESSITQPGDDLAPLERAKADLSASSNIKFRNSSHEADVAAGYFAVCREYVPGGVNGKPPERTTPVGSTPVASASPSVYQSMYRSLFERKPVGSPIEKKGAGAVQPQKRGGNVFYVVLRHGHLMLFDDDEQIEVRHVISLAHHTVSIYSGEENIPEGELFIKRNALCLSRRLDAGEVTADGTVSKPFFLFSENCSEKEDFYFALLRNQERRVDAKDNPPIPLQYDVKDIITLVQRLHSSEEHLQTRWINALIGRVFLALYKTTEVENFIRAKITKKISRVKTPSFLSQISLQKVDFGDAAPVITNPRLKDLTVDGELVVEADLKYAGNFRLEVAAVARIDLGTRFKAREVSLLLAAVLKRIEGHILVRIKPPPSNRLWISFETMPKIDLNIEPIVSSRQITYTVILRQIENRIKEVIAESLVLPNWDDSPFHSSEQNLWRGGIWASGQVAEKPVDPETAAAQEGDLEEVEHLDVEHEGPVITLTEEEKRMSLPSLGSPPSSSVFARKAAHSAVNLNGTDSAQSSSFDRGFVGSDSSRPFRSGSLVGVASPIVSTNVTNADAFKSSTPPETSHAMAAMAALSSSPQNTPAGSPQVKSKSGSQSSTSSKNSSHSHHNTKNELTPQPSIDGSVSKRDSTHSTHSITSISSSPHTTDTSSQHSESPSTRSFASFGSFGRASRQNTSSSSAPSTTEPKRISLAAVQSAAASAKTWGWNAIQRQAEKRAEAQAHTEQQQQPPLSPVPKVMGRGQPLPPPGMPLPGPDKKSKTAPIPVPKRKVAPPPSLPPNKPQPLQEDLDKEKRSHHPLPPPVLPTRRSRGSTNGGSTTTDDNDGLFVVSAPHDSTPTTPAVEHTPSYIQPWVEDDHDSSDEKTTNTSSSHSLREEKDKDTKGAKTPPKLPRRKADMGIKRVLSSSPEEDGHKLPTW